MKVAKKLAVINIILFIVGAYYARDLLNKVAQEAIKTEVELIQNQTTNQVYSYEFAPSPTPSHSEGSSF